MKKLLGSTIAGIVFSVGEGNVFEFFMVFVVRGRCVCCVDKEVKSASWRADFKELLEVEDRRKESEC